MCVDPEAQKGHFVEESIKVLAADVNVPLLAGENVPLGDPQ
jgi:hypothetical protein